MSRLLVYDTETTGFVEFNKPSEDECQPHIVEIAAVLVDMDTEEILSELHYLVKPDGWIITPELTELHGISHERAMKEGLGEAEVTLAFFEMWKTCDARVAHNQGFDMRVIRTALFRHSTEVKADRWKAGVGHCTEKMSRGICKLPATEAMKKTNFKNAFKPPTLGEAYEFFYGKPHDDQHSAIGDVMACLDVYKAVLQHTKDQGEPR